MNEELEGLVSLGIERGRDFNYIASVLADEGYSKEEIATAQKFYSQKKKIPNGAYARFKASDGFYGITIGWATSFTITFGLWYRRP